MTCSEGYVPTGSQDFSFTWKEIVTSGKGTRKLKVNCNGGVWVKRSCLQSLSSFQSSRMHINIYCGDLLERKMLLREMSMPG